MSELFGVFFLGIILGTTSGLIPGLNVFITMMLAYPLLLQLEPVSLVVLLITIASVDQYFGSVSAIMFAVPGSSTSLPAMEEGHAMFRQGRGGEAIMKAAIGSWFASAFAVGLIIIALGSMSVFYTLFNTEIQAMLFVVAAIAIIFFSNNKWYISAVLFFIGNVLSHIGWREEEFSTWGTLGIPQLYNGLPMLPVMVSLFVFPLLWSSIRNGGVFRVQKLNLGSYTQAAREMWPERWVLVRSSFIGALAGFIPGITYGLSTVLAYSWERGRQVKRGLYKPGNAPSLIAAESANNAGVFTQIIPLLFLGIPITASESLVYNILEMRGRGTAIADFQEMFWIVVAFFFASSCVGLALAGKWINCLNFLNGINTRVFYTTILVVLCFFIYIVGQTTFVGFEHLVITLVLLPFGWLLRNTDNIPLVYGFILHEIFWSVGNRIAFFY